MLDIFSTRELATIFYLILLLIYVIVKSKNKKLFANLLKTVLNKIFIIPILLLFFYASLILNILCELPFWDWILLKDILIWVLFVAIPICFKAATNRKSSDYPFKSMVIDNFVWSAILEFFIGSFTFSLCIELIVVPVVSLLVILQDFDKENSKTKDLQKMLDKIIGVIGIIIFICTINKAIAVIKLDGILDVLVSFSIPIIFSIAFLPIVYLLAILGKYHDLFIRIKIRNKEGKQELIIKRQAVIKVCGISYRRLCEFEQSYYFEYISKICSGYDNEDLFRFIREFRQKK